MAGRQRVQQTYQATAQGGDDGAQRALVAVTREIDNRLAIIGASSAAGIEPERLKMVALGAFTRTPALWTCDPVSVARSIVEAGQLGLEPTGLLGGAYLVPRKGVCTLLVGYRGLVMLAKRSGEVSRVEARVVRALDVFEYSYGLDPALVHVPSRHDDPGEYTYAYALLVFRDGGRQFDVMSYAEIEVIRKRSGSPNDGPWVTDWPEMAKKTALRRLLKLAPLTIQVAAQLDEIDPEVRAAPAAPADTRQSELRAQLQAALDREYGQGQPAPEPATVTATPALMDTEPKPVLAADVIGPLEAAPAPECGVSHEGLAVGPCTLPAGHPSTEHEDAAGNRWTMPR